MINIKLDENAKKDLCWVGTCGILSVGYYFVGKFVGYKKGYKESDEWHRINTPEVQIKALENAKRENEVAETNAKQAKAQSDEAYNRLRNTKKQYQDEIRPEIEKAVRKELETYISSADTKYEAAQKTLKEAKRENELTQLRLELMKEYKKDGGSPIILSSDSVGYSNAISAISNSDMYSSDKFRAIESVEDDRDSEYYKAIIGIAKSNMSSTDRRVAIENL